MLHAIYKSSSFILKGWNVINYITNLQKKHKKTNFAQNIFCKNL